MRTVATILALLAVAGGCQKNASPRLADVPERVVLEGGTLTLEAEAWRNQMPGPGGPGANDTGLFLVVRLRREGLALDAGVHADSAWVVNGSETWATGLTEQSRDPAGGTIEASAQGGPRWEPKTRVDVVAEVSDRTGKRARVAARGVEITAAF
jgi:hypothetical protein